MAVTAFSASATEKDVIRYDFQSGRFDDVNLRERIGILALQAGAFATYPNSFVGYSWIAQATRKLIPCNRSVRTQLLSDTVFEFPYGDAYWGRLLCNWVTYCPEIEDFLRHSRDVDYLFIDCGANYGYMSAVVSSDEYGRKQAIAIEADPETFHLLKNNADRNGNRFEIRHNAVFSKSGETVNLYGDKHEARSIVPEGEQRFGSLVNTLALDDFVDTKEINTNRPVVLKLDVEGVEIEALKGAEKLLENECVVIYEDHGSEANHDVSRYFVDDLNMRIFEWKNGRATEIKNFAELDRIKTNSRLGYDFLATKSAFWLDRIAA